MDVRPDDQATRPAAGDALLGIYAESVRALTPAPFETDPQLSRLLSLADALSGAVSLDEVVDRLFALVALPLDAEGIALWLAAGDDAILAATRGSGTEALRLVRRFPTAALAPACADLLAGEALWLETPDAVCAALPCLEKTRAGSRTRAWIGLPLRNLERTVGVLGVAFSAPRRFVAAERPFHLAIAHLAAQAIERVRLFDRESRGRIRAETLARFSAEVAAGARIEASAGAALGPWLESLGACNGTLWLRDGCEYRCVAEAPARGRLGTLAHAERSPLLAPAVASEAAILIRRCNAPPDACASLAAADLEAHVAAPLMGQRREVLGLLSVGFAVIPTGLAEAAPLAETFAAHCAVALQRASALERETAVRRRLQLSHDLTSALASARTTIEVVEVALERGLAAFGATSGLVAIVHEDRLEIAGDVGYPRVQVEASRCIPLDAPVPLAEAVRRGEPVWLDTPEAATARYPALQSVTTTESRAWGALPLLGPEGPMGVIGLSFARERPMDEDDRVAALALARTCAQALERARLYESERRMRRESDEARSEAERIGALQEQLLAVVGHDLRQPLSSIVLALRLLGDGRPAEAQHVLVERISKAAHRMTGMIRDLLDLTRARHGLGIPVERERVDLAAVTARVVEEAETLHPGRVRLEVAGEAVVWGDCSRLGQVVGNLVANALDHGDAADTVRVVVGPSSDGISLEVRNGGVVTPQLLACAFEPFARGGPGGLGLGLFIVREVVRAHGGSAEMLSSEADGTVVRVRLPSAGKASP
jgi:signal transduction histidine kinase